MRHVMMIALSAILIANAGTAFANQQSAATAYQAKRFEEAFQDFSVSASKGDAESQQMLGLMYYQGEGIAQSFTEAAKWYEKAARQGKTESQYILGTMYYSGKGVSQNLTTAANWLRKAADAGHAEAQYLLGAMYLTGHGLAQNYQLAVQLFRPAAQYGHAEAQRTLGLLYAHGIGGLPKSPQAAYILSSLAAAGGSATAVEQRNQMAKLLNTQELEQAQQRTANWKAGSALPLPAES